LAAASLLRDLEVLKDRRVPPVQLALPDLPDRKAVKASKDR
jgi:hypothetical protein